MDYLLGPFRRSLKVHKLPQRSALLSPSVWVALDWQLCARQHHGKHRLKDAATVLIGTQEQWDLVWMLRRPRLAVGCWRKPVWMRKPPEHGRSWIHWRSSANFTHQAGEVLLYALHTAHIRMQDSPQARTSPAQRTSNILKETAELGIQTYSMIR